MTSAQNRPVLNRPVLCVWGLTLLLVCSGAIASDPDTVVLQVGRQVMKCAALERVIRNSAVATANGTTSPLGS